MIVPAEHGGWAFLGEPIVLGLAVSFSIAGLLVALAAGAAFLSRQPLKLLVSDRRKGKRYARTATAERAFAACALVGSLALAGAVVMARGSLLLALGLAAPLAAAALAFDLGLRSREAAAELTAALALGGVASGIALAGGWATGPALGLWGILAARAVSSIFYVRSRLRLQRGEPAGVIGALAAQAVALVLALALALRRLAPWTGVGAMALLALRAAYGLSPGRRPVKTTELGVTEAVFGLLTILAVWAGVRIYR